MDIKASCKEVSEELARELLIAISYSLPDQVLELNSVPENFNSVDNVVVSNNDGAEKYRSELISISYVQSPDINSEQLKWETMRGKRD
ncbi:hypothetical protein FCV25MIE_25042 [Fagus crenata]